MNVFYNIAPAHLPSVGRMILLWRDGPSIHGYEMGGVLVPSGYQPFPYLNEYYPEDYEEESDDEDNDDV